MSNPQYPSASITIEAAIDTVWAAMMDLPSYGEWNPFVFQVEAPQGATLGAPITLHVRWRNGSTARSPERISVLEPPIDGKAALSYVYEGLPSKFGLVRGTRWQRLTALSPTSTLYETVEVFSGPLVKFAGPSRVAEGFRRHAQGLKARCEN